MCLILQLIAAKATPGKMYALLPCPGYIVLPPIVTGSKGLPLANTQRPYIIKILNKHFNPYNIVYYILLYSVVAILDV